MTSESYDPIILLVAQSSQTYSRSELQNYRFRSSPFCLSKEGRYQSYLASNAPAMSKKDITASIEHAWSIEQVW